jgi:predicted amino acid racemase
MKTPFARKLLIICVFLIIFLSLSRATFRMPETQESSLILALRTASNAKQTCRKATPEELSKMLAHMRQEQICERARPSVRMNVTIDGETRIDKTYEALGLRSDGIVVAFENIGVKPGKHLVSVQIHEGSGNETAVFEFQQDMTFLSTRRYLIEYRKDKGFRLYE